MNVYTYIGLDDVEEGLKGMEGFQKAQAEIEKKNDAKAVSQKMFKVVWYRGVITLWLRLGRYFGVDI